MHAQTLTKISVPVGHSKIIGDRGIESFVVGV